MSPALRLLLLLAGCTLLRGALLPPRDVRLEAQNFHVRLRWEPDPGAAFQATFQVEWRRRTSQWTDAGACWGNSTGPSWVCELYFDKIHDIYWARVRAVAGGKHSEWAYSRELQLYRDTIVGPPRLSWLLHGDILRVNIIMPLTPYRRKTGSQKPVDRVLLKLWYKLHLYEGDMLVQEVACRRSGEKAPCTFRDLKPSTRYCVQTVAADMSQERSREAKQCMMTATGTAGFPWVLLVVLSGIFLLLTVSGLCFLLRLLFPSSLETHLPKTLQGLLNGELSMTIRAPTLEPQQDSVALLLLPVPCSHGPPAAEQTSTAQQLLTESLSQNTSGYCANGFGPDCPEGRDPSCALHPVLGQVLGCQVSLPLEEDGETRSGGDVLEQPMPVGLAGDGYTEPPLPCLRSIWKRYQEYFGVSLGENCTCSWSVCSCCVGKGWISSYKLLGWFLILPASTGTGFFREALPCSCLGVSLKLCLWQGKPSSKCQAAWCLSQPKSHSLYYLFPVHLRRGGIEWRWGAVGVQPGGLTHRHVGRCGVLNRLGCILTTGRRLSQELLEGAQVLSPQAVCCQPSSSQA